MSENYKSRDFLPTTTGNDFGYAMALVETIRILTSIDKKMYVLIKKVEELNMPEKEQNPTIYAEDMGYQEESGPPHDLEDK